MEQAALLMSICFTVDALPTKTEILDCLAHRSREMIDEKCG
jgi:hypothetical protein